MVNIELILDNVSATVDELPNEKVKKQTFETVPLKTFLTKIYLILTLDCEESAKLTSDSFDRDLDWSEYWATKLHQMICSKSRKLNRQLVQLNSAFCAEQNGIEELPQMPNSAKDRIRAALQQLDSTDSSTS